MYAVYAKLSRFDLNITFDVVANLGEIAFHAIGILVVDDLQQLFQLCTDLGDLIVGVGVEEDFLQEIVVFVEHSLGDAHVTFKGGTWCILMLHDSCEHKRRDEGNRQ